MPLAPRAGMPTILVVDDEPTILELVRYTLEDERITVIEAADGMEALERARTTRPDLIFLDVQMPRLDGFEVCRRLREDPTLADVRVVMLTAAGQEADRARGFAAGANDYLTKPFSPLALFTLVRSLLPEATLWPQT